MLKHRRLEPLVLLAVAVIILTGCGGTAGDRAGGADPLVERGEELFAANCAQCHGADLTGTDSGPPLLHEYYLPAHHPDEAFRLAMQFGVQPHHWDFGPMPAQQQLDDADATAIIAFIRHAQRQTGLLGE